VEAVLDALLPHVSAAKAAESEEKEPGAWSPL
jgi:hypothetical protein